SVRDTAPTIAGSYAAARPARRGRRHGNGCSPCSFSRARVRCPWRGPGEGRWSALIFACITRSGADAPGVAICRKIRCTSQEDFMTTAELTTYAIDVTDIEYLRHGDKPLLARLYKPRGTGPFPIVVDLHGGAWCKKDRMADAGTDEPLAKSGVIVVALDFRMPPDAGYPASLADVNYAIRWCKAHAAEWN